MRMLPQQTRTSFVLDGLSRFGSRSDLVPDLWVLADAVLGYHHLLCKWQYGSPLLGFVRCHGVRFLVAALGPGGLGPTENWGPVRAHNRGSEAALRRTVPGGTAFWRAALCPPSLRGISCSIGAGASRVVVCASLSLSRSTISGAGDWSLVRFNLFESCWTLGNWFSLRNLSSLPPTLVYTASWRSHAVY